MQNKVMNKDIHVHWFFTKDSTSTKRSWVTKEATIVSKSRCIAQMC
jgi:hypothetical protein